MFHLHEFRFSIEGRQDAAEVAARSVQNPDVQGMRCKNRPDINVTLKLGQERATVTWDMPTGDTVMSFTNDLPAGEHKFWYKVDGEMCFFRITVHTLTSTTTTTTTTAKPNPKSTTAPTSKPETKYPRCAFLKWPKPKFTCDRRLIRLLWRP